MQCLPWLLIAGGDRKSTRLNSSHSQISYAVFCLKKKKKKHFATNLGDHMARTVWQSGGFLIWYQDTHTGENTSLFFFFNDTATTEIYTLSLHDALPIYKTARCRNPFRERELYEARHPNARSEEHTSELQSQSNLVCRLLLEKNKSQPLIVKIIKENNKKENGNSNRQPN